jgi:hypothetical protein
MPTPCFCYHLLLMHSVLDTMYWHHAPINNHPQCAQSSKKGLWHPNKDTTQSLAQNLSKQEVTSTFPLPASTTSLMFEEY